MTRKERYKTDQQYREKVNADNRARYHRRMRDPIYAKICATRARISNAQVAIQHHQDRLQFFHDRIQNDLRLLRKLTSKVVS